jgi:hypothetical protein
MDEIKELCGKYNISKNNENNKIDYDKTLECDNFNGMIKYNLKGDQSFIGSFLVNINNHDNTEYLLKQTLDKMRDLNLDQCHIIPRDDNFKNLIQGYGFKFNSTTDDGDVYTHLINEAINENSSNKIVLNIPFKYINELAQFEEEKQPFVDIYLSKKVSNDIFRKKLYSSDRGEEEEEEDVYNNILNFEFNTLSNVIDENTMLNFDCFSSVQNKHGTFCINQAGSIYVPLNQLIDLSNKDKTVTLSLRIPASPDIEKGKLILDLKSGNILLDNVNVKNIRIKHDLSGNQGKELMKNYVKSCWETFQKIKPTWDIIKSIHAFEYVSRAGTLPACMYHSFDVPDSTEDYWLNALKICLSRDLENNYSLDEFRNGNTGLEYEARIMVECCTLYVNYCKYITDKIDTNNRNQSNFYDKKKIRLIESFDLVRPRHAGDCEDFGKEEMIESLEIEDLTKILQRDLKFGLFNDPGLVRLSNARNKYYSFASLGGVSSATINGDYGQLDRMGAHEYLIFIPKHYFYEMMLRTYGKNGHELINENDKNIGKDVPVMVGEGTGMLRPDGKGNESDLQINARRYLEGNDFSGIAFDGLRKMYYYDRTSGSRFYQTITTLFSNEFFHRNKNYGEFVMIYNNYQNNKGKSYGVRFTDVTSKDEKPQLYVQPRIPNVLYTFMKEIQENEYPILQLTPPTNKSYKVQPNELIYQLLIDQEKSIKRAENTVNVEYYIRFDQVTPNRIKLIFQKMIKTGSIIKIIREPITNDNVGGYHLIFKVPFN